MTAAKPKHEVPPMSLDELARRMLTMPVKTRDEMAHKKRAKPRKRK
jgi:hypothetical protein